ncbi:Protein unc-45 A [Nymphon striatum]|nr:Protein unc-45 A [Nymphon striatum]
MEVAGELEDIKYESSMNLSTNTRTHVAVTLTRIYDNLGSDKYRELFKQQGGSIYMLKGPDIEAKVRVTAAINCLLLGPIDVGNQCLGLKGVIEMMLVMAGSDDPIQQRVAAEAIIAAAAKKDKCTSIISQGMGILQKLYKSKSDNIRVRALVGLCKLGAFGGHDASLKPFDEEAQHKLAGACRKFLVNPARDKDLRKWAAEGLSYLTLDADIKEDLIDDEVAIKALIDLAKTGDPSVLYGVVTTLVNITNSYYKEEVIPEMITLAKFAKQHIPEDHPMDEKKYVDDRLRALCKARVTTGLVALSKTESRNSKELIARVFNAMCELQELRGQIVQQGGTKALLSLAQDSTKVGKSIAAQALARIGITIDPEVAFPGQRCLEVVRPLICLLHPDCTGLQNFESLMALTNLAQISESVRNRILKEGGFAKIETYMYEEHTEISRASVQCMVNMLLSEEVLKLFISGETDRLKFLTLLCGNEDDDTACAAASCLCILTDYEKEATDKIFTAKEWLNCMKNLLVHGNVEIQYRGAYLINNVMSANQKSAEKLIETDIMEVLMALSKLEELNNNKRKRIQDFAVSSLKSAEEWKLIKPAANDKLDNILKIFREVEDMKGIVVGGVNINNLRYADDTVLIADSAAQLQELINAVNESGKPYGMTMNVEKTKSMVISKVLPVPIINIMLETEAIKQTSSMVYLGHMVTENGKNETEIKRRMGIAKDAFNNMANILTSRNLKIETKKRLVKCYIWSTLLYGAETWTLTKIMMTKIEAFEMWIYRRMLKISYTEQMNSY